MKRDLSLDMVKSQIESGHEYLHTRPIRPSFVGTSNVRLPATSFV